MSAERRSGSTLWLVVERELTEAFRRKAPWITAALVLAGAIALMVLPSILGGSDDEHEVALVGTAGPVFDEALSAAAGALDVRVTTVTLPDEAAARAAVEDGDVDIAVVFGDPGTAGSAGTAGTHLVAKDSGGSLVAVVRQAVATDRSVQALQTAGLDEAQIQTALAAPTVPVDVLDSHRTGRIAAASIVSVAMYLLRCMVTMQVANGVAIEKANRVSEVLLSIVPPRTMLFGKVIGVGALALVPMLAAAVPVIVRLATTGGLPPSTGAAVGAGAAWFVLGAGCYLLAAGALGALVERQEEAGSSVAGLSVLLIGSYLVGQSGADSPLGAVLAYLPFTSPMVEPARLALGVSSPVEVVGSLLVSAVALVVLARLASVVYRRAIVRTGRRLRLREILSPTRTGPAAAAH